MKLTEIIKRLLTKLPPFLFFFSAITKNSPRVFVYHRFCENSDKSIGKINSDIFEWQLRQLTKKWNVVTFAEYIELIRKKVKLPPYLLIITVDDGYADFYDIAYPKIIKYGLTATFFVTVNFIDNGIWLWPDRLQYALERTEIKQFTYTLPNNDTLNFDISNAIEKEKVWKKIFDYCTGVGDENKWALIAKVEEYLKINIPSMATKEFAPVTWEQLREMCENGIEIGAHTMNHPILSRVEDEKLVCEIISSKDILEKKLKKPVRTFCYPNSKPTDINEVVIEHVKRAGYIGAVHGTDIRISDLYRIPRMGVTRDKVDFLWKLCGAECFVKKKST